LDITAAWADPPLDINHDKKRGEFITLYVKVPWTVPLPDYSLPDFTAPFVLTAAWADPSLDSKISV
jgi:hypothetical protein